MREIKFRAWDEARTGTFTMVHYQEDDELWKYFTDLHEYTQLYGCKWKLMQYTGLKDKLGKEIYEGDIVRLEKWETYTSPDREGILFESVAWNEKNACFVLSGAWSDIKNALQGEVIGNIYENPELMQK